jgi:hypothetical protein
MVAQLSLSWCERGGGGRARDSGRFARQIIQHNLVTNAKYTHNRPPPPGAVLAGTVLIGPPLGDREYRLAQFHCHWGEDCEHGSEHQVNGRSYSAEVSSPPQGAYYGWRRRWHTKDLPVARDAQLVRWRDRRV